MKNVFLAFTAVSLTVSTLFAGGMPNKEKLNDVMRTMIHQSYTCKETARSVETNNSVLICENEEKQVRLFKVEYSIVQTGSRCGPSITVEKVIEI